MIDHFEFWQRWVVGLNLLIILAGLAIALLAGTPVFDLLNDRLDLVMIVLYLL